jgi:uncharacterized DUF497 family protein
MMRYDVCYHSDKVTIEPHFCREWDQDGGCYGTREDHGFAFDEAKQSVADWYLAESEKWRQMTEERYMNAGFLTP